MYLLSEFIPPWTKDSINGYIYPTDSINNVALGSDTAEDKLTITGHLRFNSVPEPTTAPTPTLAGAGAGNVDDGEHFYWIMFVTDYGQTGKQSARNAITITDKSVDGQVDLTNIEISNDPNVIARKIFRSKVGGAWSTNFLLTTINDNTTTTYTDNTSDANLGSEIGYWVPNTTTGKVFYNSSSMIQANAIEITSLGIGALENYVNGNNVVAIGGDALFSLTTGNNSVAIGNEALYALTTTQNNIAIGNSALHDFTGHYNIGIGPESLLYNISGWDNVAIGYQAGKLAKNASDVVNVVQSILIGSKAKPLDTGDTNEIVIGYDADGLGDNTVVLGNDNVLITVLKGDIGIGVIAPEAPLHIKIPDSDGGYLMEFETGSAQKWRLQQKGTGGSSTIHLMSGGNRTFHLTCSDLRIYKYTDQAKSFIMTAGDVDGNNGGNFLTTSSSNHTFELHNSGSGRYDFRLRNGNITLNTGTLLTDVISEANNTIGVTIDGLLIKDGVISASGVPDGSDATALHDNVGSEIFAIINKTVPDPLDVFLIEDEGSGYDKSRVTFAQVEAALNHDSLSGFVGDEHLDWTQSVGTIHTGNYIQGGAGTDTTAIHDNVAGEINAISNKSTPDPNDFLLIEDSEGAAVKKHTLISQLEAMLIHDNLSGVVADEHLDWTVSQAGMRFVHIDNYSGTTSSFSINDNDGMTTHSFVFTNGVLTSYTTAPS